MKNVSIVVLLFFFCILTKSSFSQIAINNSGAAADQSAALDISMPDKGLLIPRVTLVSTTNGVIPVNNPASGLLVYNLGGNNLEAGFYLWNGMTWSGLATMEQVQSVVHGPASAPVFGEIYEYHPIGAYSTLSVPSAGSYVLWNTAIQGDISEMGGSSSDITVLNSGYYSVSFNSVVQLPSGGKIVDAALFVNGVRKDDMHSRAWFKEGSKPQDLSFSGLIELSENDSVDVRFTMDDNGAVRLEMANLNLTRMN
jgi:hypothetical protein